MTVTIAVVENDVRILDALELLLGAEGWAVQTYTTGEAYLADLASNPAPQCLILDPHLPGMNGAEVTNAVINDNANPGTPIIVLTARPNSPVTKQIIESGARAIFTKPVAVKELLRAVRAAIGTVESEK